MNEMLFPFDDRRIIAMPGDHEAAIVFAAENWIDIANESIRDHDFFAVALSGGSTPKKIFQKLVSPQMIDQVDWSKVYLFWSDERSVPPTHPDSNFHMAMEEGGLSKVSIPTNQVFRMVAETDIELNAKAYEELILERLGSHPFDLIMLGMGDDGHTASLFPHTEALHAKGRLVVANHVPQKNTWRMTFTFECINSATHICCYVNGSEKGEILKKVLFSPFNPELYPSQMIGTPSHPALWVVDMEAAKYLNLPASPH